MDVLIQAYTVPVGTGIEGILKMAARLGHDALLEVRCGFARLVMLQPELH